MGIREIAAVEHVLLDVERVEVRDTDLWRACSIAATSAETSACWNAFTGRGAGPPV
jgi:hypothetical protein